MSRKIVSFRILKKLLSGLSPFGYKMVRYFQNPFEDFRPDAVVAVDKVEISHHIDDYIKNTVKRLVPSHKNVEGGLYVGITGVAYMFYYLAKNPLFSENKKNYLEKGMEYLKPALETSAGDRTSFLLGDAGTYALAAALFKEMGDDQYIESVKAYKSLYNSYLHPKFLKCGGDELFVGRSGYIAGALWMRRELKTEVLTNGELYKICDMIVANGREYSKKHKSPCPLMYHYYNTEYLGAAHGVSYILQILLTVPGYLEFNKSAAADIKASTEFIVSLQTDEGNWPCCMEEIGLSDHKLVHWCHGAPGTIYLMAKAFLVFKDQKFLDACIRAGEIVWRKGLLRKGPGLCHGVAGNGYVFMLLYRLTRDNKYLYRAKMFADFLNSDEFLRDARLPDNPESLYEGTAGTVCFLADLLVPDKAEFPFQDVFTTYDKL
ncbi:lanC-like protein 3 [Pectinophora gossypiella]|uniref:lanC-like protein 3 n=1 Tax=Pectinophora gossypiella TaxID=13191 RepID=UPI00214F3800|nr:lanC-like protein 3 [Pectinophora gossypiella]